MDPNPQTNIDYSWPQCNKKTWPIDDDDDDIVISGIGGRFPESDNLDELAWNLLNNIDMVTRDERRWPIGLNDNETSRSGKLKHLEYFDNAFFCTIPILSECMEPGSRIILETTYEAIADAGICPQEIRGTKTGVYVGINTVANAEAIPQDDFSDMRAKDAAFWVYGSSKALLANRISFLFDFNGPSTVIDTACSASMVAMTNAVHDLRTGNCEMAIVATSNICLAPYSSYVYHSLGLLSNDGKCKVFDKNADGFVRSETVGSLFLMRRSMAKRIYATILHAKTNTDGFKTIGLFAPFWLRQRNLMIETFQEAGIQPEDIDYFESHGTGTNVGDPQESKAVSEAYCQNRKDKLLVGAVKSNLGHTEGASGLCSVAKAIIIFEYKIIPANLHFKEAKPEIECLYKTIEPVIKNMPFNGTIIGVNSFGVGGVNAHALLKINPKEICPDSFNICYPIARLVNVSGRTEEAVEYIFNFIKNNPTKIHRDFLALLNDSMKTTFIKGSANFPFRGYLIIDKKDDGDGPYEYSQTIAASTQAQPLWLIFTGMGSQWNGMAKQLMNIKTFARSIMNSAQVLQPYGIDLVKLVTDDDIVGSDRTVDSFVAITAMQIALYDVFCLLNLTVNGIIGHSFGEIACAYADGCLTAQQAILTAYWRGKSVEDAKHILPKGLMAAVGLSVKDLKELCPEGVYIACHNGYDSVTISGLYETMLDFMEKLKLQNVFVRKVAGGEFPYHSIQMEMVAPNLLEKLNMVITEPKKRSNKWIATSVISGPDGQPINHNEHALYASGQYFVNNLQNPVYFEEGMRRIPKKSLCIEMAPHSLFNSIFKRCYPDLNYISLMKKDETDNLKYFLSSIGKIYINGFNPSIENLYPIVEWPVARGTQSISSLIKWDHSREHEVKMYPEFHNFSTASNYYMKISIVDSDWRFLKDHCIDGRIVFPLTGYLMIVWRTMATKIGQPWHKVAIHFENVTLYRPTILNESKPVKFIVQIIDITGEFVLTENNSLVCKGNVTFSANRDFLHSQHELEDEQNDGPLKLNNKEIYKELRVRGYDYGPSFQGLIEADGNGKQGLVKWTGQWISFVDSALHLSLLSIPIRALFIPVKIDSFKCDPLILFESINKAEDKKSDENINSDKQQLKSEFCYFRNIAQQNEIIAKEEVENIAKSDNTIPFEIMNFTFEPDSVEKKKEVLFKVKFDFFNQLLVTKGIEVKGLVPINFPRKNADMDLMLEQYRFIPFIDKIDDYSIDSYVQLCTILTKQLYSICSNENGTNFDENHLEMFSKFNKQHHKYSIVLKEILDKFKQEKLSVEDIKRFLTERSTEFHEDILNDGIFHQEYFTRPILELFAENVQLLSTVKILEICSNDHPLSVSMIKFIKMNVIHKFEMEYLLTKTSDKIEMAGDLKYIEWNGNDLDFLDSFISEFDLIIIVDDNENVCWNNENAFHTLSASIKPSGFLLHIYQRKQWYRFEKCLMNIIDENKTFDDDKMKSTFSLEEFIDEYLCLDKQFHKIASRHESKLDRKLCLYRKTFSFDMAHIHTIFIHSTLNLDGFRWIQTLQQHIKQINVDQNDCRIWLISNCFHNAGIIGFINCLRLEHSCASKIRTLSILDNDNEHLMKFDLNSNLIQEIISKDLVFNIYQKENHGSFRYVSLENEESIINTEHAYVSQIRRGDLSSLQWFESEHKFFTDKAKLDGKELLCDVYYSALNFKDVVIASGKIMPGPESALFDCMIGLEYSGRRNDTGQRIMGIVPFKAIATTILTQKDFVWDVPDEWTLEDAATVPIIYVTAYYALVMRAQLKPNESILIHSAAGGVGQAAINICQHYNCNLFVTVGNDQKRNYIRQKYNIQDDHIFSSRDCHFETMIKILTKGRGVDVVLNSLTGDKLQASLRCLAVNGRFLEIGKYDMQINSTLGMFSFLKNISFHGVGLDNIFREGFQSKCFLSFFNDITNLMNDGIKNGVVRPIDRKVFQIDQVEDAFRYMTNGKHIGKILIRIRQEEMPFMSKAKAKSVCVQALMRTWFSPYKVYIIAGGLGGVGLEFIYWMALRGARKFYITSRHGIKSSYQRVFLNRFKVIEDFCADYKIDFNLSTLNIANMDECSKLIEMALADGHIGGIFNLTLILEDGLFENQTMETFYKVCQPKLNGLMNLDEIVRLKQIHLDHFVTFSSFSAGRGNAGQTNYGYANSSMERIIEKRNQDGLPGIAIQFGPINDVGVVADHLMSIDENSEQTLRLLMGLSMQRINSCLEVLDGILPKSTGIYSSYVKYENNSNKTGIDDEVIRQLCAHLNIDNRPEDECLGDIGLDSMAAVEIQQRLERDFNISLSLSDVRKITVKELKNFRDGNRHNLKQYSDDIKKARANLSRLRFTIPTVQVVQLNNVQEGKPIYCLPTLIGIFDLISVLALKINRPVFGLNWTRQLNSYETLKEIVNYYYDLLMNKMTSGDQDGSYDLLAMDFGALLAAQMCKSKNISKRLKLKRLFCIDLLPLNMDNEMVDECLLSDYKVMLIFDYIRLYIPERICDQSLREVLELNCEKARVDKIIELLRKCVGTSLQGNDMAEIIANTYKRASLMIQYQLKIKNKSNSTIRRLVINAMVRNEKLQIDYIKLMIEPTTMANNGNHHHNNQNNNGKNDHLNEYIETCQTKLKAILDLDHQEQFIDEFENRFQMHIIHGQSQQDVFNKLDDHISIILNE